eukprot:gb/GECG01006944.1/.p1 GENE.gb/GECG01006944.1/~~gb/GECG01006944.1/.p1  ORF type:complete len:834 (+),score=111.58 gb/GECG01006944.1/:1-2502(+)
MGSLASRLPESSPSEKQQKASGYDPRPSRESRTGIVSKYLPLSSKMSKNSEDGGTMFRSSSRQAADKARMALISTNGSNHNRASTLTRNHRENLKNHTTTATKNNSGFHPKYRNQKKDEPPITVELPRDSPKNRAQRQHEHNPQQLPSSETANHSNRKRGASSLECSSGNPEEPANGQGAAQWKRMKTSLASRNTLDNRRSRYDLPSQVDTPSWRVVEENDSKLTTKASEFRRNHKDSYIKSHDMDPMLDSLSYDADSDDERFLSTLGGKSSSSGASSSNKRRGVNAWPTINSSKHKMLTLECYEAIIEALEARSNHLEQKRRARTTEEQIYKELRKAARKTLWLLNVMAAHNSTHGSKPNSKGKYKRNELQDFDLDDIPGSPQAFVNVGRPGDSVKRSKKRKEKQQRGTSNHPFIGTPSWVELRTTCAKIARSLAPESMGGDNRPSKNMVSLVKELNKKTTAAWERSREPTSSSRCSSDPASSSESEESNSESEAESGSGSESESESCSSDSDTSHKGENYKGTGEPLAVWNMSDSQGVSVIRRAYGRWLERPGVPNKKSMFPRRVEREVAKLILSHWRSRREEMNGISLLRAYQGTSIEQHQSEDLNEDSRNAYLIGNDDPGEYNYSASSNANAGVASQEEITEAQAINTAAELIYLKHLRNNLERARTLLDLAGRRERLKESLDEKRVHELKRYLGCIASGISRADASKLYNMVFEEGDDVGENPSQQKSQSSSAAPTEIKKKKAEPLKQQAPKNAAGKKPPVHDGKVKFPSQFYRTWTFQEDEKLIQGVKRFGPSNWKSIRDWAGKLLEQRSSAQMYKRYQRLRNHNQV